MQNDRELLTVFAILGQTHLAAAPYDARGAFVLLHSIEDRLGEAAPDIVDTASHLHVIAALGIGETAIEDARTSMAHVVATLELRLLASAST